MNIKTKLHHDNFQNFKRYGIPRAQLVIADVPYNLGANAYASSTEWYNGGDNRNGESKKAAKPFFNGDGDFNLVEYFHFCSKLLKKEPKERGQAPCMIIFCAFQQMQLIIDTAAKYGFKHYIPLVFVKNYSAQVLKANMKVVGATEYALVLYRDKLPKFRNERIAKAAIERVHACIERYESEYTQTALKSKCQDFGFRSKIKLNEKGAVIWE